MAALTAGRNTPERLGELLEGIGVAASTKIFVGGLTALNASGNAVPAADTAGLKVRGRCEGVTGPGLRGVDADNSAGSAGDVLVNIKRGVFKFANGASGEALAAADVGKRCYALDDQTVGKLGGTNKIVAGRVIGLDDSAANVWVDTRETGGGSISDTLTDNSGGTASTTIAAIGGTYNQAEVRNAVASLAAQLNKITAAMS